MRKLIPLIFCLYISIAGANAQSNFIMFNEDFKLTKNEKKARYFSKYYFYQKGEEKLLIIALDDSEKSMVTFRDGKFIHQEAYQEPEKAEKREQSSKKVIEKIYYDFNTIDETPKPNGGKAAFLQFVSDNIVYPEIPQIYGIEGQVFVQFVVTQEGDLAHIEVAKGVHPKIDAEATRVIRKFGETVGWVPGSLASEAVPVRVIVPILFFP